MKESWRICAELDCQGAGYLCRLQAEAAINEARTIAVSGADHLHSTFPLWQIDSDVVANSPYWGLIKKAQEMATLLGRFAWRVSSRKSVHGQRLSTRHSLRVMQYARRWWCGTSSAPADRHAGTNSGGLGRLGWCPSRCSSCRIDEWPAGALARIVTALDQRLSGQLAMLLITGSRARQQREELREGAWLASAALRERGVGVEELVLIESNSKRFLLQGAERFGCGYHLCRGKRT